MLQDSGKNAGSLGLEGKWNRFQIQPHLCDFTVREATTGHGTDPHALLPQVGGDTPKPGSFGEKFIGLTFRFQMFSHQSQSFVSKCPTWLCENVSNSRNNQVQRCPGYYTKMIKS